MSLQSQFKSKVLLEKIEPLTVIKNELEIGMDQDIISSECSDIKDELDILYHIIPEDLIKSEHISNNLLESEHLESIETQIFTQTENTPFIKSEFENLIKTEDASDGNLSVVSGNTHKKRKAKIDSCRLKYHCNKCKYKTLWRKNLEKHNIIHLKPNKIQYLCYHCSYKSKQKSNLNTHIFRHFKYEEVPLHCYICDFVTKKRDLIIKHFKKHPEHRSKWNKTEYKNQVEGYFKKRRRYNYCKKCRFKTRQYAELKLHELSHEAERDDQHLKYHCDQCKYKTFRLGTFKRHKLLHLEPEKIPYLCCYHCSYKTTRKFQLKDHILRHFRNEEVPFHCYICDIVMKKRDLIIEHFKKHPEHVSNCDETDYLTSKSEVKMDDEYLKYQCDKCTYKTFVKRNFNLHKLIHLKPEEIQWFYCYHCSYKSNRKDTLKDHILRHFKNEEVPFHCYICDFVTKNRDLIIKHFKKHPEHVSKCDETDNLTSKSEVKMGDQYLKYQCNKCTYKTCRSGHFKNHKLIHLKPEEIQWFYCYHCSHKTKHKSYLQKHILKHFKHEEVPFHCYICDFVTKKRDLIIEHFKKHPKHVSKCDETDINYIKKRYELTQKSEVKMDDRYLKYQCDKCTYKTYRSGNFKKHKLIHLKPEEIQWFYCYHCSYKSKQMGNLKGHILGHFKREEVPFHCYICDFVTKKRDLIFEHFKKHPEHISKYELTQELEVEIDDQYLKYQCDNCTFKTFYKDAFNQHKLIHLKPEEIQWFYCYHCSYKSKRKRYLKDHILRHFKNEAVKFHCYMCNFMTLKRKSITEHIKTHSKVKVKCEINQRP